jgi:hypothetical protein
MRGAAGHGDRSVPGEAQSEDGLTVDRQNIVRETSLRTLRPAGRACGISDIVKRRLIRVWDLQSNLRNPIHNLQVISALVHRKMSEL